MPKRLVEFVRTGSPLTTSPVGSIAETLRNESKGLIDLILVSPESVTSQPGTLFILSADLELEGFKRLGAVLREIEGYEISYPIREIVA